MGAPDDIDKCLRKWSRFILLHVAVQFSQHHVLKRLSIPLNILSCSVKDEIAIGLWVHFWVLYSVPLI